MLVLAKIEGTLSEQAKETGKAIVNYLQYGGATHGKELASEIVELSGLIEKSIG